MGGGGGSPTRAQEQSVKCRQRYTDKLQGGARGQQKSDYMSTESSSTQVECKEVYLTPVAIFGGGSKIFFIQYRTQADSETAGL